MNWEVRYYITPSGQPVVQKFIDDLQKPTRAKVFRQIELLGHAGSALGMPHAKALGGGLIELRVRSGRGTQEVRVFYAFATQRRIYLLHGFVKKTQQTPVKEIKIALDRKKEVEDL